MSRTSVKETVTEENGMRVVTREETTTTPDGRTVTKRSVTRESIGAGGSSSGGAITAPSGRDDFQRRFEEMRGGRSQPSGGGAGAQPGSSEKAQSTKEFVKDAIEQHNKYRRKHQVAPLTESAELTRYAQNWADHLIKTNTFQHSDCRIGGEVLGENIANRWSSSGVAGYKGSDAVDQWYSEVSKYGSYSSDRGHPGTGHFSQVVWKDSKEVGIGRADKDGKVIVVGSYRPAGNMMGTYSRNVFPPK